MQKSLIFEKEKSKMTWNYRVISHPVWHFEADEGAREYKIHEVFSDETGIV